MDVLVVEPNRAIRDVAVAMLRERGHDVEAAVDSVSAEAQFDARPPDAVVLSLAMVGSLNMLRKVRAYATKHVWTVVTSARGPVDMSTAIGQGADDYAKTPFSGDELGLRVEGISRILKWAPSAKPTTTFDWSEGPRLEGLRAFCDSERLLVTNLEAMVGSRFVALPDADPFVSSAWGAELPLTLANGGQEARISLATDQGSFRDLGTTLLGTPTPSAAAIQDVVRELANTVAGAFKEAAMMEGVTLTTGLPKTFGGPLKRRLPPVASRSVLLAVEGLALRIAASVDVYENRPVRSTVAALREGMVLATDLLSEAGALLVPAGTRLTVSQIDRLGRVLSERVGVMVIMAA